MNDEFLNSLEAQKTTIEQSRINCRLLLLLDRIFPINMLQSPFVKKGFILAAKIMSAVFE
ncbi:MULTISPECIES: hypothetical protein [Oceanisphaera]|uniref:Uncharacterized protein n=1 Tax=Oceanisphaera psychrotolerans TaxID=1414654 RepID=A0A1J4QBJ4_9GAMM|nr:hypothetical protein [Oceanisphaera psychrotolerans]OIN07130.1 hypothetical protein BFR47_16860 [Oceanisphaera psychrotolerans]